MIVTGNASRRPDIMCPRCKTHNVWVYQGTSVMDVPTGLCVAPGCETKFTSSTVFTQIHETTDEDRKHIDLIRSHSRRPH